MSEISEQTPRWLRRLEWLATLTPDERADLKAFCEAGGRHVKSGEFSDDDPPIHRCYHCGESFRG